MPSKESESPILRQENQENSDPFFSHTIADAMPQKVWTSSPEGAVLFCNRRWLEYTGLTLEQTRGWNWGAVVHPDDVQAVMDRWTRAVCDGTAHEIEYRLRCAQDGMYRWHLARALPIKDVAGNITLWVGTNTDIHDRKMAEQENRRLAAIIASSRDAIFSRDSSGRIISWNPAAEQLYGYSAAEAIGQTLALIVPDDRAQDLLVLERQIAGGRHLVDFETERVARDGRRIPISLTVSPILDDAGMVVGMSHIARDITERKRIQHELEALNLHLKRSMQETHHRVKNNLQLIASMLDMQLMEHEEMLPVSETRRLIQQVQTLASIHDILTHDTHSAADNKARLSSLSVLNRLITMLKVTAERYRFESRIEDVPISIRQATALALVANELVSNAVKHGKSLVLVSFHFHTESRVAFLEVQDDGSGFTPPFDPALSANTGLLLVDNLVRKDLAGGIRFNNAAAGGALVTVSFPC